jgi:hypothetical protein
MRRVSMAETRLASCSSSCASANEAMSMAETAPSERPWRAGRARARARRSWIVPRGRWGQGVDRGGATPWAALWSTPSANQA